MTICMEWSIAFQLMKYLEVTFAVPRLVFSDHHIQSIHFVCHIATSALPKCFKAQSPSFYVFIFWLVLISVTNIRSCFKRSEQPNPTDATLKVTRWALLIGLTMTFRAAARISVGRD